MPRKAFFISSAIGLGALVVISCSKSVSGRPNYIFKSAPTEGVAAKFMGQEIRMKELTQGIEGDLYEARKRLFDIKMNKLRGYVLERLIATHPEKKDLTNDQFLDQVVAKGLKVSQKEMDDFVKRRKVPKSHLTGDFKKKLKRFLLAQKKRQAIERWVAAQTAKKPVEVYIPKPSPPVFDIPIAGSPFSGGADAKVTLVEFSDFQCPYCQEGSKRVAQLKRKYGKKLKVVFKNFPLKIHNNAQGAAEASLCAHDQGKFWQMHDSMFADQGKLDADSLKAHAKKLGMDADKFAACLDGQTHKSRVQQDVKDGIKLEVRSTPTFFVNGKMIKGAPALEVFAEMIDEELAK